jgi:hypothetical protein
MLELDFGHCDEIFWQCLNDGREHMLVPCSRVRDQSEGLSGSQGDRYRTSTVLQGLWKKPSPPRSEMGGRNMWSDAFNSKGGLERIESGVARRRAERHRGRGSNGCAESLFQISPRTEVSQNLFPKA